MTTAKDTPEVNKKKRNFLYEIGEEIRHSVSRDFRGIVKKSVYIITGKMEVREKISIFLTELYAHRDLISVHGEKRKILVTILPDIDKTKIPVTQSQEVITNNKRLKLSDEEKNAIQTFKTFIWQAGGRSDCHYKELRIMGTAPLRIDLDNKSKKQAERTAEFCKLSGLDYTFGIRSSKTVNVTLPSEKTYPEMSEEFMKFFPPRPLILKEIAEDEQTNEKIFGKLDEVPVPPKALSAALTAIQYMFTTLSSQDKVDFLLSHKEIIIPHLEENTLDKRVKRFIEKRLKGCTIIKTGSKPLSVEKDTEGNINFSIKSISLETLFE